MLEMKQDSLPSTPSETEIFSVQVPKLFLSICIELDKDLLTYLSSLTES
jgi:hypothetical protein